MTETIVLGLDGATWDVLDPLLEDGALPNLMSLVESGSVGDLESVYPPTSGPAWASMATGMNPGKTGVFYFLNRISRTEFDFEPMSSADFEGRSFWDLLTEAGQSTGIFNFPMLYPPYDIDGYVVSGFGAPEDGEFTAPPDLADELESVVDGYDIKVPFSDPKFADRPTELAMALTTHLEKREAAIEHLLTERPTDVFCGVVSVTDWMQHYYWKYADESHVLHDPEQAHHAEAYLDLWRRVDEVVGMVRDIAEERGATLFVISDHGFGRFNGTFYVNDWLDSEGFRVSERQSPLQRVRETAFPYLRRVAEPVVRRLPVLNDLVKSVGQSIQTSPLETVDEECSLACATDKGFIHILSDDPNDRERVAAALDDLLTERGLDHEVYAPKDVYHGPKTDLAPDVLYTIEDFEYALQADHQPGRDVLVERPPDPARSGGHKRTGICVVAGAGVDETNIDASLLDIAPTILYNQDVPVPESMDGTVLTDVFDNAYADRAVEYRDYGLLDEEAAHGEADAEEVREHLKDLGYV